MNLGAPAVATTTHHDLGPHRVEPQSWPATAWGPRNWRTKGRRSAWLGDVAEVWRRWCVEEEPGLAVTTSGTTGTPKRIQHSRKATACSVAQTAEALGLDEGCHAVLALPTTFVAGQAMVVRALVGQWRLTLVEPSAAPSWSGSCDFVAMTPHQTLGWLEHGSGSATTLLLGGGPVSPDLLRALLASSRVSTVWEGFGMSETLTHIALRRLDKVLDLAAPFVPLPNTCVTADAQGCAHIDAPGREVHGLSTSDLVEVKDNGSFVWLGRRDDVVNSGGVLVHPMEVEQAFHNMCPDWVQDFVVYGRPDDTLGFEVVLRVQSDAPSTTSKVLSRVAPSTQRPPWDRQNAPLRGVGAVPRSDRGKVLRRALP